MGRGRPAAPLGGGASLQAQGRGGQRAPGGEWAGLAPRAFLPLPPVSNLVKAATREGEGSGCGKPQNAARNSAGPAGGLLRRREVTEEEAER